MPESLSEDSCNIYQCSFCSFQLVDRVVFVKHIFQAHNTEEGFSYVCGFLNCSRIFTMGTSFDVFRSHCSRYHYGCIEHCIPTIATTVDEADGEEVTAINVEENMDTNSSYSNNAEEFVRLASEIANGRDVELAAAHFILILKEKFKLTQMLLDYAIRGLEEIC